MGKDRCYHAVEHGMVAGTIANTKLVSASSLPLIIYRVEEDKKWSYDNKSLSKKYYVSSKKFFFF